MGKGKAVAGAVVLGLVLGMSWWAGVQSQSVEQAPVAPPMKQASRIYLNREPVENFPEKPVVSSHYTAEHPAVGHPVLQWSRIDGAVMYDVQILIKKDMVNSDGSIADEYYEPVMPIQRVYTNGCELELPHTFTGQVFYWRVRGMGLRGEAVSKFSDLEAAHVDLYASYTEKPTLLSEYNNGNGHVLLYPVYDWLAVPGAASYEVEILNDVPEDPNGTAPSIHRIDAYTPAYAQQYDDKPRMSAEPFYWRVRAIAEDGSPLGVYSDAQPFVTNPAANYGVAIYGDSISHGGGSISYSPTDWEFSYANYLSFPTVNLSHSGDTSHSTNERFENDVLPFHPRYLLILMGSNSLREGTPAVDIIADMKSVKEKCLKNGILPVFLTVPPVNPDNIEKAWSQPTVWDWQSQIELVNEYVKSQVHIDITPGLADEKGYLKTELALDGLHLDPPGKKLMGEAINAAWPTITALPEAAWTEKE